MRRLLARNRFRNDPFINCRRSLSQSGGVFSTDGLWKEFSKSDELTQTVTATYLDPNLFRNHNNNLKVSPQVIHSMVVAALDKRDGDTIHLLMTEAHKAGQLTNAVLESSIKLCIAANDYISAAKLLAIALENGRKKFAVSEAVCAEVITYLVNYLQWNYAADVAAYMIAANYKFKDRQMFFIVGGLMRNSKGVKSTFELIASIADHRRDDLASYFSYAKANKFALSMGGTAASRNKEPIPAATVQLAVDSCLLAMNKDGWFSFSLCKMVVALACASGHSELAGKLIRESVKMHREGKTRVSGSMSSGESLLDLLRGFAQGIGVATTDPRHHRLPAAAATDNLSLRVKHHAHDTVSPLTADLLELVVKHMSHAGLNDGPLQCMDLFKLYWVLAYKHHNPCFKINSSAGKFDTASKHLEGSRFLMSDTSVTGVFNDLIKFVSDKTQFVAQRSPSTGYQRRLYRIFCDELGLDHKLVTDDEGDSGRGHGRDRDAGGGYIIKIWKPRYTAILPSSLEDILSKDSRRGISRRLDGLPPYWDKIYTHLTSLSPETARTVVLNVTQGMRNYPSSEWGLLWLQVLLDIGHNKPGFLPRGMLRNVLEMCGERNDMYGMLEVLYLAVKEARHYQAACPSSASFANLAAVMDLPDQLLHEHSSALHGEESRRLGVRCDGLRQRDWNRACHIAWNFGQASLLPPHAAKESFTEVVRLMGVYGVALESSALKTVLRFLVQVQPTSELTERMIRRVHKDMSLELSHVECTAITVLLLARLPHSKPKAAFVLSRPLYKNENYMVVFPEAVSEMFSGISNSVDILGSDFVEKFEHHWTNLHSKDGRIEVYKLLMEAVSKLGDNQELLQNSEDLTSRKLSDIGPESILTRSTQENAIHAVSLMSVYISYLVGSHDQEYRKAYDLLFAMMSKIDAYDTDHSATGEENYK